MRKLQLFCFLLILVFDTALAQSEQEVNDDEIVMVSPPKLLNYQAPQLPADTQYFKSVLTVILEIEVSVQGDVTAVSMKSGVGEPFDSTALHAATHWQFSPAVLSNGEKGPTTITFRLQFKKPKVEKAPGRLNGRLLERGTRRPIAGVKIVAKSGKSVLATAETDQQGFFKLKVKAGQCKLFALPNGFEAMRQSIALKAGEIREEVFYLESSASGFETTIRTERTKSEVIKRIIGKETVEILPGTQGDTLKVVQNLPGVARPSFGGGPPVLRGSSPGDSRVFLEGQEIPLLYHFGGLRSTFSSMFLESVEFIPGNFSAYYGRATGGVIDVRVRELANDMFRGKVDVNLYDVGFAIEGPVAKGLSLGAAFRRSYVDTFLNAVIPDDANLSFSTVPRFYDYQLIADYKPKKKHRLQFIFFGSMDKLKFLLDDPLSDPAIRDQVAVRTMFHNVQLLYRTDILPTLRQVTSLQFGYQEFRTKTGPELYFDLDVKRLSFRSTWHWSPLSWFSWRMGIDNRWDFVHLSLRAPLRPLEGEERSPISTQDKVLVESSPTIYEPSVFTVLSFEPVPGLIIDPSLRIDWYRQIKRWTFDPRLMIRYVFPTATELKAGFGVFHQPPSPERH